MCTSNKEYRRPKKKNNNRVRLLGVKRKKSKATTFAFYSWLWSHRSVYSAHNISMVYTVSHKHTHTPHTHRCWEWVTVSLILYRRSTHTHLFKFLNIYSLSTASFSHIQFRFGCSELTAILPLVRIWGKIVALSFLFPRSNTRNSKKMFIFENDKSLRCIRFLSLFLLSLSVFLSVNRHFDWRNVFRIRLLLLICRFMVAFIATENFSSI